MLPPHSLLAPQTGAGKTHSLLGPSRTLPEGVSWPASTPEPGAPSGTVSGSEDGLLPRALHEAYAEMKSGQAEGGVQYIPSISIMEIYNEKVGLAPARAQAAGIMVCLGRVEKRTRKTERAHAYIVQVAVANRPC